MTTRKVPAEAVEEIEILTDKYRQFRALRRELLRLQQQIQEVIGRLEESGVQRTRKPFRFLDLNPKIASHASCDRRKKEQNKKTK